MSLEIAEIGSFIIHYFVLLSGRVVKGGRCQTPQREPGKCLYIRDCAPMVTYLETIHRPYPEHIVKGLKSYTCGYFDKRIHVCCPLTQIIIENRNKPKLTTTPSPPIEPPDVSNHENLKLLPEECGYLDMGDRIRKGINAVLNEFPWMALLSYGKGKL